jgi:uncharacterized protein (TIGR03083 family)
MTADEVLLDGLATSGLALGAVGRGELETAVPSCPGWTVAELIRHTGTVHRWADKRLRTSLGQEPRPRVDPPHGAALLDWFDEGVEAVLATLANSDLDGPCDTWAGERTRRWWLRRLAHETTIHAWDATVSLGTPFRADGELAADGIDELFEVFLARVAPAGRESLTGTVHVHASDVPGEWLVTLDPEGASVRREHAKGDVALRGPAWSLLLVLWRRRPPADVEVFGDEDLAVGLVDALRV